jgi:DNA invertase Pin-like site-specific DNA recombinase
MSNLLLSMMGAFAEFERSLIKERQREGIELAKKKGIYKGRVKSLSAEDITKLNEHVKSGNNKTALAKEFGISRQTLYAYLKA